MSDLISRQAAKDALKEKVFRNLTDEFYGAMQVLDELPSVEPKQVEKECSSRQPCGWCSLFDAPCHRVIMQDLPSAQPERKKGEWELVDDDEMQKQRMGFVYASAAWLNYRCSNCGAYVHNDTMGAHDNRTNYCGNCGADMRKDLGGNT